CPKLGSQPLTAEVISTLELSGAHTAQLLGRPLERWVGQALCRLLCSGTLFGRDLDFDPHPWISQTCRNHCRCRPNLTEVLAKHGPTLLEVCCHRSDVGHTYHVFKTRTRLLQRIGNVLETLLSLRNDALSNRHRRVVEAGGSRDEDPITVNDRSGISDLGFECGA